MIFNLCLPKIPFSGNIVTLRSKLGTIFIHQEQENNRKLQKRWIAAR